MRRLLGIALPERAVPTVLGIDDFALRRSRDRASQSATQVQHRGGAQPWLLKGPAGAGRYTFGPQPESGITLE